MFINRIPKEKCLNVYNVHVKDLSEDPVLRDIQENVNEEICFSRQGEVV